MGVFFGSGIGGLTRSEAGAIEHDVNFLGAFDLEDLGDGAAPFGGGFPMDIFEGVAVDVISKLFEIASFADLALGMNAEGAAMKEHHGDTFAIGKEVGIDAEFR